ncbi:MAG: radical SAM protein, partial [Candidatus Hydrogenedentota bacterium]
KYGLNAIEFHDEEFFVDRKRGQKIGEMINGEFQWYVQTRMDDLLKLDLDALERQGLRVVQPGLETGSPRILKMIRKGETLEDFHKANRKLASTGIRSTYNFMMGYPTETHEDLVATVELALKLLDENPKASISGFYVYVPYPGAELFEMAVRDGFEPPETLEGWAVFNRQHLASPWIQDRRDVLEMLLYTSKFVDGRRLKQTFTGRPLLLPFIGAVSRFYRRRWRKHNFEKTLDIDLLALAARHVFGW